MELSESGVPTSEILERIKSLEQLYSHYFLNLLALKDEENLSLVHCDIILNQGQTLLKESAKCGKHFEAIKEVHPFAGLDKILEMIQSGVVETQRGSVKVSLENSSENCWTSSKSMTQYTPKGFPEQITEGYLIDYNTHKTIENSLQGIGMTSKAILESIPGIPYKTLPSLIEYIIGHRIDNYDNIHIRILAPLWSNIIDTQVDRERSKVMVRWVSPKTIDGFLRVDAVFELATTGDGYISSNPITTVEVSEDYARFDMACYESVIEIPENAGSGVNIMIRFTSDMTTLLSKQVPLGSTKIQKSTEEIHMSRKSAKIIDDRISSGRGAIKMSDTINQVFISLNNNDLKIGEYIGNQLKRHDIIPKLYDWDVAPGDSFIEFMETSIEESRVMVLLWSTHAQNSFWVSEEYRSFHMKLSKDNRAKIIVVRLDRTPLPELLRDRRYIEYEGNNTNLIKDVIWGIKGRKG